MEKKKNSKGKMLLIAIVIFLAIGIISGVAHNLTGSTPKDTSKAKTSDSIKATNDDADFQDQVKDAAPNTSDMVDKIALQAKQDAATIDEAKTDEAITYIKETYPNYFDDNDVMEKTMYYGYLLEYAYKDTDNSPLTNLGMDTYQAVKYVYRGAETIDDDGTQENLRQISEDLEKVN